MHSNAVYEKVKYSDEKFLSLQMDVGRSALVLS